MAMYNCHYDAKYYINFQHENNSDTIINLFDDLKKIGVSKEKSTS